MIALNTLKHIEHALNTLICVYVSTVPVHNLTSPATTESVARDAKTRGRIHETKQTPCDGWACHKGWQNA